MHTMFMTLLRISLPKEHSPFPYKTCINNLHKTLGSGNISKIREVTYWIYGQFIMSSNCIDAKLITLF